MRLIYADPGLQDHLGHHANFCRVIRDELQRRGVQVVVLSYHAIKPPLATELNALPIFRAFTYWQTDGDPYSGWLNAFNTAVDATIQDLRRVQGIAPDDIVYLCSAQPAQFMSLVGWWKSLPAEQRPHVVLEFGTDPGVDVEGDPGALKILTRDYRVDPRPMFYRFAACQLVAADLERFHMVTLEPATSAVYSQLLGHPVGVLPAPLFAPVPAVNRAGHRPVTIAVLGHQRPEKGFHLMPKIAARLLSLEPDIRLLIHNSAPDQMPLWQLELREIAASDARLTLEENVAGADHWQSLLDRSDLILCPYDPARFGASHSGVAMEAAANAIPTVVPAGTSLSRLLDAGNPAGTTFASHDPETIVAAVRQALSGFDTLASRAHAASGRWNANHGVAPMVTALLALCGED